MPPSSLLPRPWIEIMAPDGRPYYHNTETGETTWDRPDKKPKKWTEHKTPEGQVYYYNAQNGESVWEKPEDIDAEEEEEQPKEVIYPSASFVSCVFCVVERNECIYTYYM